MIHYTDTVSTTLLTAQTDILMMYTRKWRLTEVSMWSFRGLWLHSLPLMALGFNASKLMQYTSHKVLLETSRIVFLLKLCICMHVGGEGVCTYVHLHLEDNLGCHSSGVACLFWDRVSGLELSKEARLARSQLGIYLSCLSSTGLQVCITMPSFLLKCFWRVHPTPTTWEFSSEWIANELWFL